MTPACPFKHLGGTRPPAHPASECWAPRALPGPLPLCPHLLRRPCARGLSAAFILVLCNAASPSGLQGPQLLAAHLHCACAAATQPHTVLAVWTPAVCPHWWTQLSALSGSPRLRSNPAPGPAARPAACPDLTTALVSGRTSPDPPWSLAARLRPVRVEHRRQAILLEVQLDQVHSLLRTSGSPSSHPQATELTLVPRPPVRGPPLACLTPDPVSCPQGLSAKRLPLTEPAAWIPVSVYLPGGCADSTRARPTPLDCLLVQTASGAPQLCAFASSLEVTPRLSGPTPRLEQGASRGHVTVQAGRLSNEKAGMAEEG